jgi:hypothetical protein
LVWSQEKVTVFVGDLGEKVATEFAAEVSAPLVEAAALPSTDELKSSIFTKIRFSWTNEDRNILDRIRAASDAMFVELFADAITVVDTFYASMRVPAGTGPNGRMTWLKGEDGRTVESIDQLTGQDIRQLIVDLERVLLEVSPQVSHLKMEAIMAHNIAKDISDDAWFSLVEGTQGDRTARANRESRQDRWHAHFRLYAYEIADSFLKELNAFIRRMENLDFRISRSQS